MPLKIAHFAIFAPHASGQYGTVKDLILAERALGHDAQFIDCGSDPKKETVRENLTDGELTVKPLSWALENADVCIRHTLVPEIVYDSKPVVMAMHGRPESSFLLEFSGKRKGVISTIRKELRSGKYAAAFTFWEDHVYPWQYIHGVKIHSVPPPINSNYSLSGERHDFGKYKADINLVIVDMWRDDQTPFNLIFAAQYFKDNYQPNAKLHIYGAYTKNPAFAFLAGMQNKGVIGEFGGVMGWIDKVYRSADILLTPNIIATRVIREAMASGLPIVAPHGCKYTPHQAEPRDYKAFAAEINKCYKSITPSLKLSIRKSALELFDYKNTAKGVVSILEKAVNQKQTKVKTGEKVGPRTITKDEFALIGVKYCKAMCDMEELSTRTLRRNERAIELAYVFKNLTKYYPSTVLDVGTGQSSLPHLMNSIRFEVDAIDSKGGYWKDSLHNRNFNRHFNIQEQDICRHTIERHYDFITCVSTLEHIENHPLAVKNMLELLNPDGVLLITVPYNENEYLPNAYKQPDAGYGQSFKYICQVFSRKEVESWGGTVIDQEYWRVFHGKFWTVGRQYYPPIQSTKEEPHQLTCLLMKKTKDAI